MAKHHWKAWEDEILKNNWQAMTDEEIANKVGRKVDAVSRRRKILGLSKKNGRPSAKTKTEAVKVNPNPYSLANLSKEDRIAFYKSSFDENFRYKFLSQVLLADELEYYQHKYIEFMDSIDSINLQEEDLLHNMIMCDIQILRLQRQVKDELEAYRKDSENERPPSQYLYKDLSDAEGRYIKYQEKLNLTRQQRLKDNREETITISSIVGALMDKRNRAQAGKEAGTMEYFLNRCKDDMNKMNFLLGG